MLNVWLLLHEIQLVLIFFPECHTDYIRPWQNFWEISSGLLYGVLKEVKSTINSIMVNKVYHGQFEARASLTSWDGHGHFQENFY